MKKLLSLILVTSTILTGCGSEDEVKSKDEVKSNDVELIIDTNIEGELTLLVQNNTAVKKAIVKFREKYPNVTFDVEWINDQAALEAAKNNLLVEVMAGSGPDIISMTGLNPIDYIENDYLVNLNDLIDLDDNFNKDDFYTNYLDSYEYKGGLYELPTNYTYSQITINKNAPENVKEKFNALDTVNILDMYELYSETDYEEICPALSVTNLYFYEIDEFIDYSTKTINVDSEESIALLEKTKEIYEEGFKFFNINNSDIYVEDSLTADEALFYLTSGININYVMDYETNSYESPKALSTLGGKVLVGGYNSFGINNNSENKALAWEFIKFLNTEYYNFEDLDAEKEDVFMFTTNLNAPRKLFDSFFKYYYKQTKSQAKVTNYTDEEIKEKLDNKYNVVKDLTSYPVNRQFNYILRDSSIVVEEFRNYIEDKQTLETTVENMTNRLYIQMNE